MIIAQAVWMFAGLLFSVATTASADPVENHRSYKTRRGILGDVIGRFAGSDIVAGVIGTDLSNQWSQFPFDDAFALGTEIFIKVLKGEKPLEGRENAARMAAILAKVPKGRRQRLMEAEQGRQERQNKNFY